MRISTQSIHHAALTALLSQQSMLSKTQTQIASGKRVQTPADDPIAAVHIMELQRALAESEQFDLNADMAKNRLTLEESGPRRREHADAACARAHDSGQQCIGRSCEPPHAGSRSARPRATS